MSLVASSKMGTLMRLPGITRRKVGRTSKHHAPYVLGYTHATMAGTERKRDCEVERNSKAGPSSDCRLQLACMKSELLVIADQNAAVNAFPGLVHTARHTMEVGGARSWSKDRLPKAKSMTGVKS